MTPAEQRGHFAEQKRAVREQAKADRAAARLIRRRERRCFWTWPWGHRKVWRGSSRFGRIVCVVCGQESVEMYR